jgi:hypothetical protein
MDVPLDIVLPPALLPVFRVLGRAVPALWRQRTLFVGSPCADEGTVGLLPGVDRAAALLALSAALEQEARRQRAAMLVWKDFSEADAAAMRQLAQRAGLFPLVSYPGAVADLPRGGREDFLAAMKGSRRHQLRKKLRLSAERVAVRFEAVQRPEAGVLNEIFGLFWQTYEHSETKFERLNRRFFECLALEPRAHFLTLREAESGAMIAFMLCFDMGGRVINKFIGLDYARPKEWMLYFRLWGAALDWAMARGANSIQSGQTGYGAKMAMGHRLVPLTNYCRHRNPLFHLVYKAVARGIDWSTLDAELARYA